MIDIGNGLKNIRKEHNLTLEQLSKLLNERYKGEFNFNKGKISKWENGKEEPRLSSVKMLADFYGVNIDELYLGKVEAVDIMHIYNQLNDKNKQRIYEFAEQKLKEQNEIATLPRKEKKTETIAAHREDKEFTKEEIPVVLDYIEQVFQD